MWNIFKKKEVEQTGFIDQAPRPTDYLGGTLALEVINEYGDWRGFLPKGEHQRYVFDTLSCVSFATANSLEVQLKKIPLSDEAKEFLKEYDNNFSDRFLAIMSGTTSRGNSYQNVLDAVRMYGMIPESMFPFGGSSFDEYHNRSLITEEMLAKGRKFLEYFDVGYEFATRDEVEKYLVQAPPLASIPIPSRHAILVPDLTHFFDTYEPFYKLQKKPINYLFRVVIKEKQKTPFAVLKRGTKDKKAVKELQTLMKKYLPQVVVDGAFGPNTEKALKWLQGALNLRSDGIYGFTTKQALDGQDWLPVTNFNPPVDRIVGANGVLLCLLQRVRNAVGFPMVVSSSKRTVKTNEETGGVKNSSHLIGLAVDILARPDQQEIMIAEFKKYGVDRFGRYPGHLHADIDLSKAPAEW